MKQNKCIATAAFFAGLITGLSVSGKKQRKAHIGYMPDSVNEESLDKEGCPDE